MKLILMLGLGVSFLFTGNLWTAVAVIVLGLMPDEKSTAPVKPAERPFVGHTVTAAERESRHQNWRPSINPAPVFLLSDYRPAKGGAK